MADSVQLPTAEGGRASGGTNWMLLGAMGVGGFLLLFILMRGKSDGGAPATTAAGTSINAALGSIQEQQLNAMGQASAATGKLSSEITGVGGQVATSRADLTGQIAGVNGHIAATNADLAGQLAQLNAGVVAGNQGTAANAKQYYDLLTGRLAGLSSQVTGVSGQVAGVGNQVAGVGTQIIGVQSKVDAVSGQIVADNAQQNQYAAALSAGLKSLWDTLLASDASIGAQLSSIAAQKSIVPTVPAVIQQAYQAPWQPTNTGRTPGASGPGGIWNNPSTGHPY